MSQSDESRVRPGLRARRRARVGAGARSLSSPWQQRVPMPTVGRNQHLHYDPVTGRKRAA